MSDKIDVRKIREQKQISLQQAFEDTKISKRVLEAIESGDLSELFMSPVYVKGFVKTYARYLGIDPDALVKQLFPEDTEKVRAKTKATREGRSSRGIPHKLLAIVGQGLSFIRSGIILVAAFVIGHVLRLPKRVWLLLGAVLIGVLIAVVLPPTKAHLPQVEEKSYNEKPKPIQSTEPANAATHKKVLVLVEANEDCWIRVKSDGVELFRGTLHKGDIEKWEGKREVSLWVGNAGALKVTCNGKVYENIGRPGQVIKELVFSPDGSYHIRKR